MDVREFEVRSPLDGTVYRCRFHNLIIGIAPRHSDTIDVKFLVNGTPVVLALPHVAFAEYREKHGRPLTDQDAVRIAGLSLKQLLERAERVDQPLITLTRQQTLALAYGAELPSKT
jgi:hypothetical protein